MACATSAAQPAKSNRQLESNQRTKSDRTSDDRDIFPSPEEEKVDPIVRVDRASHGTANPSF
jgi:hypothetical protein